MSRKNVRSAKSNGRASRTRTRNLCVYSSLLILFLSCLYPDYKLCDFCPWIHAHHGIHHTHTSYRGGDADNRHNVCPRPSVLYVLQLRSTSLTEQARPSASARTTVSCPAAPRPQRTMSVAIKGAAIRRTNQVRVRQVCVGRRHQAAAAAAPRRAQSSISAASWSWLTR